MQSLTVFYAVVAVYFISRVLTFIHKCSEGDFKASGYSSWLVPETLLLGVCVFLWLTLIHKQE